MDDRDATQNLRDQLTDANERAQKFEKGMDDAIDIVMKRDSQLEAHERKIMRLENLLDRHRVAYE